MMASLFLAILLVTGRPARVQGEWSDAFTFRERGGLNSMASTLAVFDDGTGSALYVGGYFTSAGGGITNSIAKWDGSFWSPLGSGTDGMVFALTVFDDGTGPALYAGGSFTVAGGVTAHRIAKWNGSGWSPLGAGVNDDVYALTVFDDGTGPALYAGGIFTVAGGVSANRIARWNGSAWSAVGSAGLTNGVRGFVEALTTFDDGTGSALYAGGYITSAGGVTASSMAKWDGSFWSPLGSGTDGIVFALTVFDDGNGSALYAGGDFTLTGGGDANRIAKWNGSSWSPLGNGMNHDVYAMTVFDDGTGPALFAGGFLSEAGGGSANFVAKWNGSAWSPLSSGVGGVVTVLSVFDDGTGSALYAGGFFTTAGGVSANRIAKWSGVTWSAVPDAKLSNGMDNTVAALTAFDAGTGPALYAGGSFTVAGGVNANYIASWNGSDWSPLGSGVGGVVYALTSFDDGTGPALYAGGSFITVGGGGARRIAKWNGSAWSSLGYGMNGIVSAFAAFDDGTGSALYAGGAFTTAGGVNANYIAKWNGAIWSPVGTGMNGSVEALTVFDDGTGAALYAGGSFTTAGGVNANYVAKWNGSIWSPLGSGMEGGGVSALTAFDDGTGPALYAGGSFVTAGGGSALRVAKWNGSSWSALGSGVGSNFVRTLTVFDDGTGPALCVGGGFFVAGGVGVNHIARWNGSDWLPLGSGMDGGVSALTVFDDGTGPALYAGGGFTAAGDHLSAFIAAWRLDCNDNDIPDVCEVSCGAANGPCDIPGCGADVDCNTNNILDACDVMNGVSRDCNADAVPDECACVASTAAVAEPMLNAAGTSVASAKNRFLSFSGGDAGPCQAVRVKFVELPGAFGALNGTVAWVTPPQTSSELPGKALSDPVEAEATFSAARLSDSPVYADWRAFGVMHVFDERVIPSRTRPTQTLEPAVYEIQLVTRGCDANNDVSFSPPLTITNPRWGDVASLQSGQFRAPDGSVDVTADVLAVLAKFSSAPNAPIKARAELVGTGAGGPQAAITGKIDISDVLAVLGAFSGGSYPFPPPL